MEKLHVLCVSYNHEGHSCILFLSELPCEADVVIIASQECCHSIAESFCCNSKEEFTTAVLDAFPGFELYLDESLNAEELLILKRPDIKAKHMGSKKLKLGTWGANKGALIVNLVFERHAAEYSFTVCAAHLEAGSSLGDIQKRQSELEQALLNCHDPTLILGDLNFRVELPINEAFRLLNELVEYDEFKQYNYCNIADIATIGFSPTYKIKNGEYCKRRTPSYTDRILIANKNGDFHYNVKEYSSINTFESDHFPVFAVVEIEDNEAILESAL